MEKQKTLKVIITFASTTQAIFMEQCCKKADQPGRLIPVPREISAGCGMAWCAAAENKPQLLELVKNNSIGMEDVYELPM